PASLLSAARASAPAIAESHIHAQMEYQRLMAESHMALLRAFDAADLSGAAALASSTSMGAAIASPLPPSLYSPAPYSPSPHSPISPSLHSPLPHSPSPISPSPHLPSPHSPAPHWASPMAASPTPPPDLEDLLLAV